MNHILLLTEASPQGDAMSLLVSFAPLVLVFVAMYFLMIKPQKKRQKEIEKMRNELTVGNRIVTIGGFIGRITRINDDELFISLGNSKEQIAIRKWAVHSVLDPDQAKAIEKQLGMKVIDEPTPAAQPAVEEVESTSAE